MPRSAAALRRGVKTFRLPVSDSLRFRVEEIRGGISMTLRGCVLSSVVVALVASAGIASAAPQKVRLKDRGNAEEQRACTPDVFRLCFSQIPNEPAIVSCLKRSMPQLSPGCRAVFQTPGGKSRRTVSRRRGADLSITGSIRSR